MLIMVFVVLYCGGCFMIFVILMLRVYVRLVVDVLFSC